METKLLFGGLVVALAFGFAFAAAFAAAASLRSREAALAAQGEKMGVSSLLLWRLRNGYGFAGRLSESLLGWARVRKVADELVELFAARGWVATARSVTDVSIVAFAAVGAVAGIVVGSPIAMLAVPLCGFLVVGAVAGNYGEKRKEQARDAVPAALESMAACFGSGFTLLQTFQQVSEEVEGPLGETFARSAHVLEMGGSAERALEELRNGSYASELAFVAVALDVQHQSGGGMRQVLDAATDTVKGELSLRRALRVQTAQAKLSARVVVVMPFVLVAAFSLASPDFLLPFFSSAHGLGLLILAIVMQASGILLVRRALSVEGVA